LLDNLDKLAAVFGSQMKRLWPIALLACLPVRPMAGPYATEWTQLANYAKLVQQLYQQAQMVRNQIEQLRHASIEGLLFNSMQFGDMARSMILLGQNVRQGQGLSYTMARLDQVFRNSFPGYANNKTPYDIQYRQWGKVDLDTMAGVLASIGAHTQDIQNDRMIFSFLQNRARTAQGQDQILQTGLEISDAQVEQLAKLRQMMQLQVTAMVTAEGHRVQSEAAAQQTTANAFGPGVFGHN